MSGKLFDVKKMLLPQIVSEEKDFIIVYKPPKMHSAPLAGSAGSNILEWCAERRPEIMELPGRKKGEGGLLHRLDFETQGLMLIARTEAGMEALLEQQEEGTVTKEYSALAGKKGFAQAAKIESMFRPYGPGRKLVRPVLVNEIISDKRKDKTSEVYTTEIVSVKDISSEYVSLAVKIVKGFRHQIRSHLAWYGMPILNDKLYGGGFAGKGFLALRATSLFFRDPSGKDFRYSLAPIMLEEV